MFLRHTWMSLSLMLATAMLLLASSSSEMEKGALGVAPKRTLGGVGIPLVGLGCASGVRDKHVFSALEAGYRFFDTAQSYSWGYHEDEVGDAIQRWRKEKNDEFEVADDPIFIQTKIHPEDLGYEATKRAVMKSLDRLKSTEIDSVLIHKPQCWPGACSKEPEGTWQESWKALEELYSTGIITKSIGICDVGSQEMLDELLSQTVKPHVIQNWMDPFHQDRDMRRRIQKAGILYQAYSSLGTQWHHHKGFSQNPVMNHPTLIEIAENHNADVGQVVINWATTRHGISVLPASTSPSRQEGNLHGSFRFKLKNREMDAIDRLNGKAERVSIEFENPEKSFSKTIDVYWVDEDEGIELEVLSLNAGTTSTMNSYVGHTFRFKDPSENVPDETYPDLVVPDKGFTQRHKIIPRVDDDEETVVVIIENPVNSLAKTIGIYYVDKNDGSEHLITNLNRGENRNMNTDFGHIFRFKDPSGNIADGTYPDFVVPQKGREHFYKILEDGEAVDSRVEMRFQLSEELLMKQKTIDLYWLNPHNGENKHVGSLSKKEPTPLQTFVGHTYRFKDPSGDIIDGTIPDYVIPQNGPEQVYTITASGDEEKEL